MRDDNEKYGRLLCFIWILRIKLDDLIIDQCICLCFCYCNCCLCLCLCRIKLDDHWSWPRGLDQCQCATAPCNIDASNNSHPAPGTLFINLKILGSFNHTNWWFKQFSSADFSLIRKSVHLLISRCDAWSTTVQHGSWLKNIPWEDPLLRGILAYIYLTSSDLFKDEVSTLLTS